MNQNAIMTFADIFTTVDAINIPVIQRDYAQGRQSAQEIRQQFLHTLEQALRQGSETVPLDLDFVYGSLENGNLSVLDGQQRLTTLFLLHWLLAGKENESEAFRQRFTHNGKSRFSYQTRASAAEFLDALVIADPARYDFSSDATPIDEQLIDSPWFYLSWLQDPTVASCLTMLCAIQQRFCFPQGDLFQRLCDRENKRIVFHYLNLENFGLSDDLYIKMNARGKALTDFENFKAWLSGRISQWPTAHEFSLRLDQQWTDLFWLRRNKELPFDTLYLRFFMRMAFLLACGQSGKTANTLTEDDLAWFSLLRDAQSTFSPLEFGQHSVFTIEDLAKIKQVLDYFCSDRATPDAHALLTRFITTSDYLVQAQFYALTLFILRQDNDDGEALRLQRWQRITNNLLRTMRLDYIDIFIRVLAGLNAIVPHAHALYTDLTQAQQRWQAALGRHSVSNEQWKEEILKVGLIMQNIDWETAMMHAEDHPYLQGRIRGLLALAYRANDECHDRAMFTLLVEKSFRVLDRRIVEHPEHLLERALLTQDDYLVQMSGDRYTFCHPANHSWRDRSKSWLAVVEKPVFGRLLAHIDDNDVADTLRQLIAEVDCGGWRELIVKHPEVISYTEERLLDKEAENIYLLSKSTRRGYFFELHSYVLAERLRYFMAENALPKGIKAVKYYWTYGDDQPWLEITLNDDTIRYACYLKGRFAPWEEKDNDGRIKPLPASFARQAKKLMPEIYPAD
ncbi:hypothetical protein COO59_09670 [Mixta theicola]|uniref:GmrSD restriction endonucleases N-terminal domain-containing protein n=1 Tax=Mixta theicola TaxID=1458355 RepID=A0A2K1Q9P5_9GAMM|nr:DUF262 domain-containing protein [Mixta theicola]PNS11759.1 hypothetical protein COO59_09670 [Mixta theicola]GLR07675.1 hypothetical protein GCM10007905_03940 [Mixta theicola]